MQFVVLGAGRMGRAIAWDLARAAGKDAVRVFDARADAAKDAGESMGLHWAALELADPDAVRPVLEGADVAVSAADYSLNEMLTRLAIETKTHLCDLGGNNTVVARQRAMHAQAERAGVTIVPDCGLAPGLAPLLAYRGVERVGGRARAVKIRVGGLPQRPQPPLDYAQFFAIRGLTNEYLEPVVRVRGGKNEIVETMVDVEPVAFAGFPALESFNTSGGCSTLPETLAGRVDDLDYQTIRYAGHARIIKAMIDLGMLGQEPIDAGGTRVVPRVVTERLLETHLPKDENDVVLVRVTVEGDRERVVYEIVDRRDPATGHTAMARTTGYPTAVIAWMLGTGRIEKRGVLPGELCVPVDALVEELRARGIAIDTRTEALKN
jgi:lysine 6-dehydrogenase